MTQKALCLQIPRCCLSQFAMRGLTSDRGRHTSPLIWIAAIVCTILAIAVIITGAVVLAIYMIYQPKVPYIKVVYAQLDNLVYDQSGLLEIEMTLTLVAENDNSKAQASFSDQRLLLQFHGITVAKLQSAPLDVPKNSSLVLDYPHFRSSPIGLDEGAMQTMDVALKQGIVPFDLNGNARARWRVGILLSVRFWTNFHCRLRFFWPNGSAINLDCSSKIR